MFHKKKFYKVIIHSFVLLIISFLVVFIVKSIDVKYDTVVDKNKFTENVSTAGINTQSYFKLSENDLSKAESILKKRNCATVEYNEMIKEQYPEFKNNLENLERDIQRLTQTYDRSGRSVITIPVVVHVVYNTPIQNISGAQVQTQIDVMNEDFRRLNSDTVNTPAPFKHLGADVELEFCLARRDPNNNPTLGITRTYTTVTSFSLNNAVKYTSTGGHDIWDRDKYLNIWVCNLGGILGYAQFPGGPPSTDGVVSHYLYTGTIGTASSPYHLGRTVTHEIGHWLNLWHIWGDDGGSCVGSDFVDDTPNQADETYGCPPFPQISCNNGPNGDMFMNYMDYSDDACFNIFTLGQSTRMNIVMDGIRVSLKTSNGCSNVSGVPLAEFTADSTNIIYGGSVNFSDLSAGIPTNWNWTFTGGSPSSSNVQNPTVAYSTPGSYSVKLIVSNTHGSDTLEKVNFIHVDGAPMAPVNLLEPPNISSVNTNSSDTSKLHFKWTSAGSDPSINYKWKIKKGGTSNEKVFTSNNSGADTVFTIRHSMLDSIAQDFGTTGDSVLCAWSVWSYNGVDSASSNIFIVILKRTNVGITQISSTIPDKFSLGNNYPNPFNPTTKIVFDLPKAVHTELKIYDVMGREVETLVNNNLQPGRYEYTWNAHTLSSGIYFYRIKAGKFIDNKRMVLIK